VGAARDARAALNRYAERLSRSADPVLHARADLLAQSEQRYKPSDARFGNYPRWDATQPTRYDGDSGSDDQLPYTPG
jgi:hypothetical protein